VVSRNNDGEEWWTRNPPNLASNALRAAAKRCLVLLKCALWHSSPSFSCCIASAAPTDTEKAEIEHLLAYLGSSSCTFSRNGTWYSAEAVDHLVAV
jgi:hypothetical protein